MALLRRNALAERNARHRGKSERRIERLQPTRDSRACKGATTALFPFTVIASFDPCRIHAAPDLASHRRFHDA
jgi:hypothetical protein